MNADQYVENLRMDPDLQEGSFITCENRRLLRQGRATRIVLMGEKLKPVVNGL